jgi:hypothetical protein
MGITLMDDTFNEDYAEWEKEKNDFLKGICSPDIDKEYPSTVRGYIEAYGQYPDPCEYVDYKGQECNFFAVYEGFTNGTPLTPSFPSLKALEDYLVNIGTLEGKFPREVARVICSESIYDPPTDRSENERLGAAKRVSEAINASKFKRPGKHL